MTTQSAEQVASEARGNKNFFMAEGNHEIYEAETPMAIRDIAVFSDVLAFGKKDYAINYGLNIWSYIKNETNKRRIRNFI